MYGFQACALGPHGRHKYTCPRLALRATHGARAFVSAKGQESRYVETVAWMTNMKDCPFGVPRVGSRANYYQLLLSFLCKAVVPGMPPLRMVALQYMARVLQHSSWAGPLTGAVDPHQRHPRGDSTFCPCLWLVVPSCRDALGAMDFIRAKQRGGGGEVRRMHAPSYPHKRRPSCMAVAARLQAAAGNTKGSMWSVATGHPPVLWCTSHVRCDGEHPLPSRPPTPPTRFPRFLV